ncbi:immunity protein YezG family protein [Micromonospora sp. NPDC005173]|uniref:immunity protein YezG family protein n=1 Tax=Micromonospora sp. NPDC005173 TaxID=3157165 RepID=UPI0033BA8C6A
MPDGSDSDIITRIGQILMSILPDNAATITVNGEADIDYANAALELRGPDGTVFYFGWDDNPDEAVDEIADLLIDLRQVMAEDGSEPWYGFTMAVQSDGTFEVDFSYEPPTD